MLQRITKLSYQIVILIQWAGNLALNHGLRDCDGLMANDTTT